MKFVKFPWLSVIEAIYANTSLIVSNQEKIMALIDVLEAKVAQVSGVVDSENALLQLIHDELVAALAANNPARVQAVIDELETKRQAMLDAIAANPSIP